jgi:hypothetical protein
MDLDSVLYSNIPVLTMAELEPSEVLPYEMPVTEIPQYGANGPEVSLGV